MSAATERSPPMLRANGLAKSFAGTDAVVGVDLRVGRGETVALLGPNGAGKTTVFSMVIGIETPDAGRVTIDGVDVTRLPVYARAQLGLSYLPQESSVFRGLSVENNILLYLETFEPDRARRRARLDALLAEVGLTDMRRHPAARLSGGQRRRCELARTLATEPAYLLLDEPFAGVDPLTITRVRSTIRALRERGMGILISDHNVRETLAIADRAYIIESGRLLAHGTPAEVIADERVRHLYLGSDFAI